MYVFKKTDERGYVKLPRKWEFGIQEVQLEKEGFLSGKKSFSGKTKKVKTPWEKEKVVILEYEEGVEIWRMEDFVRWREEIEKDEKIRKIIEDFLFNKYF